MQSAEIVVEVLRARGRRGLPCERLYRQLFSTELFLMAWGRIYANDGAMTPGSTGKPRTACHWPRSGGSSMRCATSATGSSQSNGFTSRKRAEAKCGRSAFGAADVIPFVPIRGISLEQCALLALLGRRRGKRYQVPGLI